MDSCRPEVVIFDVEAIIETKAIIEFGAIIVCPQTLVEKEYFSSVVRPQDDREFGEFRKRRNGLDKEEIIASNIFFCDIAHNIYDMLDGRIWVGHNIKNFDRQRVEHAFHSIGWSPPEPSHVIDTLELCQRLSGGAIDLKMETLAEYFALGQQNHRALDDVRLNLRLLLHCAAVLFLTETESINFLRAPTNNNVLRFPYPEEFSIPSLRDESYEFFGKVREPISCTSMNVKFGVEINFRRSDSSPRLSFVVDSPDNLSTKLDEFDGMLQRLFSSFRIDSEWLNVVDGRWNPPTVRLRIINTASNQTIVCKKEDSGKTRRLFFKDYDSQIQTLLTPSTKLDAHLFVETYNCEGRAGIRLVAHKLIIHP